MAVIVAVVGICGFVPSLWDNSSLQRVKDVLLRKNAFFWILSKSGWQKLREGTRGFRRKVSTRTKILSPYIRYFVAKLRFVAIYDFGQKRYLFGQELHYYMVYIAYCIQIYFQICNYLPKRRICPENSKYAPDEKLCVPFYL